MMNFSCYSLILKNQFNSPIFSTSDLFFGNSLHFYSVSCLKHENSFFCSKNIAFSFKQSMFVEFLSAPIVIDSVKYTDSNYFRYSNHSINNHSSFQTCIFRKCKNKKHGGNGGAIYYNSEQGKIVFKNCGFDECLASNSGGAFYINSKKSFISNTCIYTCRSLQNNMAFFIRCMNSSYTGHISMLGIGPDAPSEEKKHFQFDETTLVLKESNISHSNTLNNDGFMHFSNMKSILIDFVSFFHNGGPGLKQITNSLAQNTISYCNFVENECGEESPMLYFSNTSIELSYCVFSKNNFETFIQSPLCNNISFSECTYDFPKKSIGYDDQIVTFLAFHHQKGTASYHIVSAPNRDICFKLDVTKTFMPSSTFMLNTISASPSPSIIPSPTIQWLPKYLVLHQYILFAIIAISFPFFLCFSKFKDPYKKIRSLNDQSF